jgi:hypothetical protein
MPGLISPADGDRMTRRTTCQHRGENGSVGRLADALDPGSLLVLVALRAWVSADRAPDPSLPDWRNLFRISEVSEETAGRFDRLMGLVRHGLRRALDVRCCFCPCVGTDEESMLRLVAALQRADRLAALDELTDWLGPEAAMWALPAAETFAGACRREGLAIAAAPPRAGPEAGAGGETRAN